MGVLLFVRKGYQPNKIIDEIDYQIGRITDDKLFKKEIQNRFKLNNKEFDDVLDKIVDKYVPLESLWDLLPVLRKKYKLVILNNGTALTLSRFKNRYHLDSQFDLFVSSAIEGVKKPSENIYLSTARKLGILPKECLFMDDSELNIKGAEKCGMKTIWWKDQKTGFAKFHKFIAVN